MSNSMGAPGGFLAAAQAATYAKGQEVQSQHSDERREKERQYAQLLRQMKSTQQQQKAPPAGGKGFLA